MKADRSNPTHTAVPSTAEAPDWLGPPAEYFPLESGRYEIRPGLARLGTDFGNGAPDARVFQLDRRFLAYRRAKLAARAEQLSKYHPPGTLTDSAGRTLNRTLVERLQYEYPQGFVLQQKTGGARELVCRLSGETLRFDANWAYLGAAGAQPTPAYRSGLDALACQVQEDLAIVQLQADGSDTIAALHLCFPNHWAAEAKIGRSFIAAHRPVAGIEPIARNAHKLVRTMIDKGPFVRFAWGLATDDRLNHHPDPPPGTDPAEWAGRHFDPGRPRLFLRVERQTTYGLPTIGGALFTIRTYFSDCERIRRDPGRNRALHSAIASMSPESLAYKGLTESRAAILNWLRSPP